MKKIPFRVEKKIAILSENSKTTLELNRVAWGDYPAKLDLRRWDGDTPLKGVPLTDDEARALRDALVDLFEAEDLLGS